MKQPNPPYRKKVFSTLKEEAGLIISENEFYSRIDSDSEYRNKVYTTLKEDMGLTISNEEFHSRIQKKKDNSTSLSPKQNSASVPQNGSLVGAEELNPLAVKSPFDNQQPKQEQTPVETSSEPSKFKEGTMAWNLEKMAKTRDWVALDNDVKQATTIPEEKKNEIVQEVEDEANNRGVWNNINKKGKEIYNSLSENLGPFSRLFGVGNKVETDPLAEEKKQAVKLLSQKGYKPSDINNDLVKKTAIEIKVDKRLSSEKDSMMRDYLSDAEDDFDSSYVSKKDKLKLKETMKVAGTQQQKTVLEKQINIKDGVLISRKSNLDNINNEIIDYHKRGEQVPESLLNQQKEELSNFQNSVKESIAAREEFVNKDFELKDAQSNLDYFKRDYSKLNNIYTNIMASTGDLISGGVGAVDYALGVKQSVLGDNGVDKSIQLTSRFVNKQIKDVVEDERGKIIKPMSVDDVHSMNDFGRWMGYTVVSSQVPVFATIATGASGIAALGVSATGAKYEEMVNEMNPDYSDTELALKPLGYGVTETASAIVDRIVLGNAGKILKAATEPERQMIAKGVSSYFLDAAKDVSKNAIMEGADEGLTQGFQNLIDGKPFMENMKDPVAAGAAMGAILPFSSHVVSQATKPFSADTKIQNISNQILSLQTELDKASSEESKSIIKGQIDSKNGQVEKMLKQRISNIESLSKEEFDEIIRLEKAQQNIKNQVDSIKSDTSISDEMSDQIIGNLKEEFTANESRRKELMVKGNDTQVKSVSTEAKPEESTEPTSVLTENESPNKAQTSTPTSTEEVAPSANIQNETASGINSEVDGNIQPRTAVVEQNTNSATESNPTENIQGAVDGGASEKNIFYTGRKSKVTDFNNTKGEFIFFSKNPEVASWYGGDMSNVTEAEFDTSNFFDLSSQEKKSEFVKNNFTKDDVYDLFKPIIEHMRFDKDKQNWISNKLEELQSTRFSGDGELQNTLLRKIKEKGFDGVILEDTHFGKMDNSYVVFNKSIINKNSNSKSYKVSENGKNYSASFDKGVLNFQDESGNEPSAPTKRKLQEKWSNDFDFTAGRRTHEIEAGPINIDSYEGHIAEFSENPSEVAETLLSLQNQDALEGIDYKTKTIAEYLGSKGIEKQSFIDNSDANYITQGIALQYFAKKGQGRSLDTLAQEMSSISRIEITEQDIVDFILDNPSGVESFKNSVRKEKHGPLEQKFTDLTGLPANQKFLEKAVSQQIEKDEWTKNYATEIDFLSDENILSLLKDAEQSYLENHATTEKTNPVDTGTAQSSDSENSTSGQKQSGVQSESGRENSPSESTGQQLNSKAEKFKKFSDEKYTSENEKNIEWAKANEEKLVNDYIQKRRGKPINDRNKIDPDAIREAFTEIGYDGTNVPLYVWATNHITNLIYDKLLSETENKTITVLTGIGGSGKTHATRSQKSLNLESEGIVYDSALNDIRGLSSVVQKAIDSGFRVQVIPVYAEPVTAFKRAIQRGHNEGRWLSAQYFLESFALNKGKLFDFKEMFPKLAVLPLQNQGDVVLQTLDEAINEWNYKATSEQVLEILKIVENEINSGKLNENEITAIGADILGIEHGVGIWTVEMDGIANRVAQRVQSIWERGTSSGVAEESSGRNDQNRLNNQSDSEFDNTDLEDDIEVNEQGFFSSNKQNLRDLLLSKNGPVKLRFPFQKHFKRVFSQTFKANAGLDIQTGEVIRSRNRTLSAFTDQLEYESNQFNKIIRDIKKLNPKKVNESLMAINDYMSGNKNADVSFLNYEQKEKLDYFRERIDSLSKSVVDNLNGKISDLESKLENYEEGSLAYQSISDAVGRTQKLIDTIESNMEKYINRSYQIFSDDEYRDNITGEFEKLNKEGQLRVRNAINYLIREEGMDKNEATKAVAEYLSEIRRSKSDFPFSSTGNASTPFLKKRKDIPKEFRELLGESKDPLYNYINTVYKLSQYVANIEYQSKLRDHLINSNIGKLEPELGYVKLTSNDDGWRILNDIYVPVDFKDAMDDMQPLKAIESGFYKAWIKIAGITKINKTILSPTTTARNLISGVFLGVNAGHFFLSNPKAMAVAWNNAWTTSKSQKELFSERQKLLKLGVLGDGSNSGELLAILNDFSKEVDRMVNKNVFTQFFDIAKKAYAFGDDFYKVTGFYIEKNRLMEYGMTESEAEDKAAFRINNGYPTYSYLPKNMQRLRRLPLVGTFVSFPYESIRSTKNNILIVKEDLEAGRTKLAYKRIAGLLVANATLNGLSALTMSLVGITDDDDDAIRDMLPEWQRNSKLIYMGTKNGKPIFVDGTALFPSETIFKPISTLIEQRDGRKFEDNFQEALNELLSPYISKDITFKTLMEVSENKNQFGQKIYLSDNLMDGVLNESDKIINYLMKQVGPGVYNNITEFMRANEIAPQYVGDKFSSYGKEYTNEEALLGLMGMRISTINYHAAMSSFAYQVKDTEQSDKSSASKLVKTSKVLSEKEIESIVKDYGKYHSQNFEKMLNIVNSGKKMGMSNTDIRTSLKMSKLSEADINALINGRIPDLRPLSPQSVKNYKEKLSINYQGENISDIKRNFDKNVMLMTRKIFEYNKESRNKKKPK